MCIAGGCASGCARSSGGGRRQGFVAVPRCGRWKSDTARLGVVVLRGGSLRDILGRGI